MTQPCIKIEELARILELDLKDPQRIHLEECPRCRALLKEFEGFMEAPHGAGMKDADFRLNAFIDKEIGAPKSKPFYKGAAFRVFLGAAALVFAYFAIHSFLDTNPPDTDGIVLREPNTQVKVKLLDPVKTTDQRVKLGWEKLDGAEAYVLKLYSKDLEELTRLGPTDQTSLEADLNGFPRAALYRVFALKENDEIAASPLRSLE